jgi:hypothetical protein
MSYDRAYMCRSLDPTSWVERRQVKDEKSTKAFDTQVERAFTEGNVVVLRAGANHMFDEAYAFEQTTDAEQFYQTEFAGRECIIDDKPCGFQEVSLYRSGKLVATKSGPAPNDQDVVVSLEQSKNEETSSDTGIESDEGDLLDFE